MKAKLHRLAWLCAALFVFAGPSLRAAEWLLTFSVSEEKRIENPKTDPPKVETRAFTQTVALGAHYLAVQDERLKLIYDFAAGRSCKVRVGDSPLNAGWPLYGEVGSLEDEARNRNVHGAAMRAGNMIQQFPLFDRFEIETALRVALPPGPQSGPEPIIEHVKQGEAIEFRHGGQTVVRFVPAKKPLPGEYQRRFVNYLAYSCAIHPKIRQAISATGAIPQELVFASQEADGRRSVTLRLLSSAPADTDSSVVSAGAKPLLDDRDPFAAVYAAMLEGERSAHRVTREEVIVFANEAVARGAYLDALLALLEFGLQSGTELSDEVRKHQPKFGADANCQLYFRSFLQPNQTTKEAFEKSLASNAAIDRTNLQKGHMLDLQRASLLERLGRPQEALEHYFKVIRANPLHTGALSDLGLFYARGSHQPKAWFCWEAALRLAPDHPFLKKVKGYGQRFETTYPDFF